MRIALLSALSRSAEGREEVAAFLSVAGSSIIHRQIKLAHQFGCSKVLVLVDDQSPQNDRLTNLCSSLGLQVEFCDSVKKVANAIGPDDELLLVADGLAVSSQLAEGLPFADPFVMAVPAYERGDEHERIDASRRWFGLALIRGQLAQRLREFPEDIDTTSTLLRLALQDGTPILSDIAREQEDYLLLPFATSEQRGIFEEREFATVVTPVRFSQPLKGVAQRVALSVASKDLPEGFIIRQVSLIFPVLCATILLALYFELVAAALFLCSVGTAMIYVASTIEKLRHFGAIRITTDTMLLGFELLAIAIISLQTETGFSLDRIFAGVVLFGTLYIAQSKDTRLLELMKDRATLFLLLSIAALFDQLLHTVMVLCVYLIAVLLWHDRETRITTD